MKWYGLGLILCVIGIGEVYGQSITPALDGINTVVEQSGQNYYIRGGTQAGSNLFHSLERFGLSSTETANFVSRGDIANILTRVVGGEASIINGLVRVTGGNSNLYIINPAGIVFGTTGKVDVHGAFVASTANGIQLGDNYFGINTTAQQVRQLSSSINGLAVGGGAVINQGQLTAAQVALVGGTVQQSGEIKAGDIVLSATAGDSFLRLSFGDGLITYKLPAAEVLALGGVQAKDLPHLLTGTAIISGNTTGTGRVAIAGEQVELLKGAGLAGNLVSIQVSPSTPLKGYTIVERVRNYEEIVNSASAGQNLILLNKGDHGIAKVSQLLAGQSGIEFLQFITDGNAGQLWIGQDFVDKYRLADYREQISSWRSALAEQAEILFYACNLASNSDGQWLLQQIGDLTQSKVGASSDLTGQGGNWNLEYGNTAGLRGFNKPQLEQANVRLGTLTVTSLADGSLSSLAGDGLLSLREAIMAANTDSTVDGFSGASGTDEIRFAVNGTITLTAGELVVSDPAGLSIVGNGISNTIISGNNASRLFNVSAGDISFSDLTLKDGKSSYEGGAVRTTGNIKLTNVSATDNYNFGDGGAIWAGGDIDIANSLFSNNQSANGGAVYATGNIKLTNVSATGNRTLGAIGKGGAIWAGGDIDIANSLFSNNQSSRYGGAVYATGNIKLIDSQFTDNRLARAGSGGAVYSFGTMTVTGSSVIGNEAGEGGGLFANQDIRVENSQILQNFASIHGGGIRANGSVLLINSDVNQNITRFAAGGGIFAVGNVRAENSRVLDNWASDQWAVGEGGAPPIGGGGIYSEATVHLLNSSVAGNRSRGAGGGVRSESAIVERSDISWNTAYGSSGPHGIGGGIMTTNLTMTDGSVVWGNSARASGGISIVLNGTAVIRDSLIGLNQATDGGGGGIGGSNVQMTRTTVLENTSRGNGAGINAGDLQLIDSRIIKNVSENGDGGGIFAGTLHDTASVIAENRAQKDGGGIFTEVSLTLEGSKILDNQAGGNGGGFRAEGPVSTVTQIEVKGNSAGLNGGGLYVGYAGNLIMQRSTVQENTAGRNGAGIWFSHTAKITDSNILDNRGTGIYYSLPAYLPDNIPIPDRDGVFAIDYEMIPNTDDYFTTNNVITIERSTIARNQGDGLFLHEQLSGDKVAIVNNSTISSNTGTGVVFGTDLYLYHNTIVFNEGGGVLRRNSTARIGNSIIAGNNSFDVASNSSGRGYRNAGGNLLTNNAGFSDVFDMSPDDLLLGALADNGGYTLTHALLDGSPAIDAGATLNYLSFTTDQTGEPRVIGSQTDIGAYEYRIVPDDTGFSPSPSPDPSPDPDDTDFSPSPSPSPSSESSSTNNAEKVRSLCARWDQFVVVDYDGQSMYVPIEKCNDNENIQKPDETGGLVSFLWQLFKFTS